MSNDPYLELKKALDVSNKENSETFKVFSKKLDTIDNEVKNILHILEGNPQIPTQKGLSQIVFNNHENIEELKKIDAEKRLNKLETKSDRYDKILYKVLGGATVIFFILGIVIRYIEKNLI